MLKTNFKIDCLNLRFDLQLHIEAQPFSCPYLVFFTSLIRDAT